ncbi:MAG: GUN4 domain-containing protein [Synechococcales bacterium]|nr:GUN4 domain-containing protein [Cyanobacteria bacterium REEB444]MEB3124367.1 GUN4 domain-containing protein [Synechococcales bacterium]
MSQQNELFSQSPSDPPPDTRLQDALDFTHLTDLLATHRWLEADQETDRLILTIVGRTATGWLRVEDISQVPCTFLTTLDYLWSQASEGAFGFFVQYHLWVESGGTQSPNWASWQKFGEQVGWLRDGQWLSHSLITASKLPKGYLPFNHSIIAGSGWFRLGAFYSRLAVCGGLPPLSNAIIK